MADWNPQDSSMPPDMRKPGKMRAALEAIASHDNHGLTDGSDATRVCLDWMVKTAKEALEGSTAALRIETELRGSCEAATPGEWWVNGDTGDVFASPDGSTFIPAQVLVAKCATGEDWMKNAVAIARCVNFVRKIIENPLVGKPPVNVPNELRLTYRNWRGETSERRVDPRSTMVWLGATEWHPEPQWLIRFWDLDRDAVRDFAWADIIHPTTNAVQPQAVDVTGEAGEPRELLERMRDEAQSLSASAWSRSDGGQDFSIASSLLSEAADTIERLVAATRPAASGAAEVVTGEAGEIERLRAVLDNVADLAEEIRLDLVTHLDEPVRSAFWKGVKIRNLALSTLEASIATRPAASGDGGGEVDWRKSFETMNAKAVSNARERNAAILRAETAEAALASMTAERDRLAAVVHEARGSWWANRSSNEHLERIWLRLRKASDDLASPQADAGERG